MARFGALLTNYGNAAITRAFLTGNMVNVVDFALGDGGGGPYTPTPDMTELRRETWRTAVSHGEIDPDKPNEVVFYAILPPELDIGYIREMAVFDDKGYMVAVANTPEVEKVSFEEGAGLDAVLSIAVEVVHAEVVKYEVNPYSIIATKHDLDKHNTSDTAHEDIREDLQMNANGLQELSQTVDSNMAEVQAALLNKANVGTLQKHDIVFSSPFYGVNNGHYYGKTQDGIVFLHFICKKDALGLTTGAAFAVLPEGFRPATGETLASYVSGTTGTGRQPCGVNVSAEGNVSFISLSGVTYTSMNYIDFACSFPT